MDYFTHEWARGDVDDVTYDDVLDRYRRFVGSLDQSTKVGQFANEVSLNTAHIDHALYDGGHQRLELTVLNGDLQIGYWRTRLIYTGARLSGEDVLRRALARRPTEVWYDEFSQSGAGMKHSFLLEPLAGRQMAFGGEFSVAFDVFAFEQQSAPDRRLLTEDDRSHWL